MHQQSLDLFQEHALPIFASGQRVLELGPDAVPSAYLEILRCAGLNLDWSFTTFDDFGAHVPPELVPKRVRMLSLYQIDAPSDSFDVVFSGQVLEHVPKPWRWMPECARVLKPGGRMIVIVPALCFFHEMPVDCWRVWPDGIRALFEDSGLRTDYAAFVGPPGLQDTIGIGTKVRS